MVWVFGDHELDEGLFQLRRRSRVVPIEPKVFDVLRFLLRHRERVVSKHELLDALWPGEAVSDSVLPRSIAAARRAVRDDRTRQRVIQTVHGRGYRFVAAAREEDRAAEAPAAPRPPDPPAGGSGFVGREAALATLRAALADARRGRGRVVLLVGEPGIGKTRTAEELGAEAERAGARFLAGHCYEGEGAPAFWPWLQVLRAVTDAEAGLATGAAEIAELLPGPGDAAASPSGGEGEQARFRLFDGVVRFLARSARRRPLVVALDDLHWADPDSLRLLHFAAPALRDAPILLLALYRDVEVRRDHPLRALLGDLAREPHCERVALRGLAPGEVVALVTELAGATPKPELVDAVASMTEGNPFFVREVVALLAEEGRLEGDAGGVLTLSLPQGVRDAVGRRLDSLSSDCNELLRAAAVIGRDFDTRVLARVAGVSGEPLLELLGEAGAAGVLAEAAGAPGHYAFTHALVKQTLLEELRAPRRVLLHRRTGETLAALYGGRPNAPLAELAHHFFEAAPSGTAESAVLWSVRAAERAHAQLAYDESARHYERALEALDFHEAPDSTRRCELLVALGDELRTGGAREAGRARLSEAADLARELGRADLLARAAIGYRGFGEMGVPPDARTLALLEEALDALGHSEPGLRSRLLSRLTGAPPYALSMATRERLSRESWELARELSDPEVLTDAVGARYWATLGPDRIEERIAVAREARLLGERLGDRHLLLMAHEIDLGAHLVLGDRARIEAAIEGYTGLAEELRQPVLLFIAGIMQASRAMNTGAFAEAEDLIRTALERGRGTVPFAEAVFAGQVYWLLHQKGELERVAPALLEVGERFRERFSGVDRLIDVLAVSARVEMGDLARARDGFEALGAEGFRDFERDEHWLLCMAALSDAAFVLGDAGRASALYALLAPRADCIVSHDLLRTVSGSVHAVLGELATTLGRPAEAVAHYERALAKEEALGARPAALTSQAGLASALELRGGAGDRERARALLREAEAGYRALGGRLPRRRPPPKAE